MIRTLQFQTRGEPGAGTQSRSFSLFLMHAMWVLMIFEVDWFLTSAIGGQFFRIPTLLAPILGLIVMARSDRRMVYWPLILFVFLHVVASLLAENAGAAREALKFMLYMVLLFAGSVSFMDSATRMIGLLKLYLLSFAWFGVQGLAHKGMVSWHPLLANEDSYGPLMVIAMPFAYFFALATSSRRWRWISRGLFLVSVLGLVVSFARGAALAAVVVLLHLLLRSPNRTRTMAGLVATMMVLLPVAATLVSMDAYIDEIASSSQGDDVRTTLWKMAWNVFQESPLYGVGARNFGVVAAHISPEEMAHRVGLAGSAALYSQAIHNPHLQILAEEGLLGFALWITMIVSYFRWIKHLLTTEASTLWRRRGGEALDLQMIARGLEGAMLAYLATSVFYNQLYIHWFWSLLAIAYSLVGLTRARTGFRSVSPLG